MFDRRETMQHKAMHDVFRQGQRNDTTGEKHSVGTDPELRNCQQTNCEQGRYWHFAEINDCGHEPNLGARPSSAQRRASAGAFVKVPRSPGSELSHTVSPNGHTKTER